MTKAEAQHRLWLLDGAWGDPPNLTRSSSDVTISDTIQTSTGDTDAKRNNRKIRSSEHDEISAIRQDADKLDDLFSQCIIEEVRHEARERVRAK